MFIRHSFSKRNTLNKCLLPKKWFSTGATSTPVFPWRTAQEANSGGFFNFLDVMIFNFAKKNILKDLNFAPETEILTGARTAFELTTSIIHKTKSDTAADNAGQLQLSEICDEKLSLFFMDQLKEISNSNLQVHYSTDGETIANIIGREIVLGGSRRNMPVLGVVSRGMDAFKFILNFKGYNKPDDNLMEITTKCLEAGHMTLRYTIEFHVNGE